MRLIRSREEIQQSPVIQEGYVSRPQWMRETADGTEPYICCVFLVRAYL